LASITSIIAIGKVSAIVLLPLPDPHPARARMALMTAIVQATSLEPAPPRNVTPPAGYWQREASHYPQPLTPAFRMYPQWGTAIWRQVIAENGMMMDGIDFVEIGGLVYQRIVPIGGKDRTPPPPLLMKLIVRLPPFRARVNACAEAARATSSAGRSKPGTTRGGASRPPPSRNIVAWTWRLFRTRNSIRILARRWTSPAQASSRTIG